MKRISRRLRRFSGWPLLSAIVLLVSGSSPALAKFEIGFYDNSAEHLCTLASAGVSLVVMYLPRTGDPQTLLDEAAKCGIRLALQVQTWLPTDSESLGPAESLIRLGKRHRALAAWYVFDEPELHVPLERLQRWMAQVRALDPEHPTFLVHSAAEQARTYAALPDWLGIDYYPVTKQPPLTRSLETIVPLAERLMRWARTPRRPAYFVVQSFSWSQYQGCPNCRFPSKEELRYLTYAPIVSGVDGIIYWTRYRTPEFEWKENVGPLIRELAHLRGSLEGGREGALQTTMGVRARTFRDGIVIAVNDGPRQVRAVRIQGPRNASHAEIVSENRRLPAVRGMIVDSLPAYGVRVYRFPTQKQRRSARRHGRRLRHSASSHSLPQCCHDGTTAEAPRQQPAGCSPREPHP